MTAGDDQRTHVDDPAADATPGGDGRGRDEASVSAGQGTSEQADRRHPVSDDPDVVRLWERYKTDGDPDARERLILQYAPLVKYVAGRVGVGLPSNVEHADLASYGMFGLIDALDRFDMHKGVKFETYAISRIRGAMIDELRSMDWIPRSVRTKARNVERAISTLEHRLGRTPSETELAEELNLEIGDLRHTLSQVSLTSMVALDEAYGGDEDNGGTLLDKLPDRSAADPAARAEEADLRRVVAETVEQMGERERTVVMLYYFDGMTLSQIGEVLGVTESRVSQIHSKAVLGLRSRITERISG